MQVVFVNVLILFMLLFLGFILGRKKIVAYSSIKDENVIKLCDEYGIAMVFTSTRHLDIRRNS